MMLAALAALLWHEAAHVLAMKVCGVKRCRIELTPFGGMADAECFDRLPSRKQAVIAIAGVAASSFGAWLCTGLLSGHVLGTALFHAHLSLAFVNCLPLWPLDGARVVMALAAHWGIQGVMRKMMLLLAYIIGGGMVLLGLYGAWHGVVNLSLLLLGPYLAYAAHESAVSETVRQIHRLQQVNQKLHENRILPVKAYACEMLPGTTELLRLLKSLPPETTCALVQLDERSGEVKAVHTEQMLATTVFHRSNR